jgi:hypothetical protein
MIMKIPAAFWVMVLLSCRDLSAQVCPPGYGSLSKMHAKEVSSLHGKLIYHEDLWQWHELKLDNKTCDSESVEVFSGKIDEKQAHRYRNCSVTITGRLFFPNAGSALSLAIDADKIQPDRDCKPHPVDDLSKVPIPKTVRDYIVTIQVDYINSHTDVKIRQSAQGTTLLTPWQAYASYYLTGGRTVIWFDCAEGFDVIKASQIPKHNDEAIPSVHGDNFTEFDGKGLHTLTFQCQRSRR